VSAAEVERADVVNYGILDTEAQGPGLWKVKSAIEKPTMAEASSRLALTGRYVFDPEIFQCLREIKPDHVGEFRLTRAMTLLAGRKGVIAACLDADHFDAREKL